MSLNLEKLNHNRALIIGAYGSIGKRHYNILRKLLPTSVVIDKIDINAILTIEQAKRNYYDIVAICTPNKTHIDIAKEFLYNAELIFIEKPLDSNLDKIKKSLPLFKGKNVHVACNIRYTDAFKRVKAIADDVLMAHVVCTSYLPYWHPESDHLESYSAQHKLGGGVLLDVIHEPDYVAAAFGLPDSAAVFNKRVGSNITKDTEDTCAMLWSYPDKAVTFNLSYCNKNFTRYIDLILKNGESERFDFNLSDILPRYRDQWIDIINNGTQNTYEDAYNLYKMLL